MSLEVQRSKAHDLLMHEISVTTNGTCKHSGCGTVSATNTFLQEIILRGSFKNWPPSREDHDVRSIIHELYNEADINLGHTFPCGHNFNLRHLTRKRLRQIGRVVSDSAPGLCLACAREEKPQSGCKHEDVLRRQMLTDPIFRW